jgi:hypothetical protein
MNNKILISFREGCSGNWLAELLVGSTFKVFYRQDQNGRNIPLGVYHFDGNLDSHVPEAFCMFSGQKCVTCHSTNYELLRHYWPEYKIVRIQPQTHILDSIESAYNKIGPDSTCESVDLAFEYIKNYYFLHTKGDPLPEIENSCVIDYGQLRYPNKLTEICKNIFDVMLTPAQIRFAREYWNLQVGRSPIFKMARHIYEFEKRNNYKETDRLWTINDVPESVADIEHRYR